MFSRLLSNAPKSMTTAVVLHVRCFGLCVLACACVSLASAQSAKQPVVNSFTLSNGMKVVVSEDHSSPQVYGAVMVHVGSKHDPEDATGCAHYFEHIMFKGTDSIGTIDWATERVYLDSIRWMYDSLPMATTAKRRESIQQRINELSVTAARYAIPNELDVIMAEMGATGLNAATSYDVTTYHNYFPANQLAKWMEVYAERFRHPVFRLFQTELEAVYEEKNMYEDTPGSAFMQEVMRRAFGHHAYSRPIIGYGEHLKNPSLTRMSTFYETYYVANNMTLLLVGDVDTKQVQSLAEASFGRLRSAPLPADTARVPMLTGHEVFKVKQTPIRMGVLLFPGLAASDSDNVALRLLSALLSNGNSGLLDRAVADRQLLAAQHLVLGMADGGLNAVVYVPRLVGQGFEDAEQIVQACLDSLMEGKFSDDLFVAAKMGLLREALQKTERLSSFSSLLTQLEAGGLTYADWRAEQKQLTRISREEVVAAARRLFGGACHVVRSGMGSPKKEYVPKPDWKPLEVSNSSLSSPFAKRVAAREVQPLTPQKVRFGADVRFTTVNDAFRLYSSLNPRNDIFRLEVVYNYGLQDNADLDRVLEFVSLSGVDSLDAAAFDLRLRVLGGDMTLETLDRDRTRVVITGVERNFDSILFLCARRLTAPKGTSSTVDMVADGVAAMQRAFESDAASWASALGNYVLYGERSLQLRNTPLKQWRRRSAESVAVEWEEVLRRDGFATFSGTLPPHRVAQSLRVSGLTSDTAVAGRRTLDRPVRYGSPRVFVAHNRHFQQSNVFFFLAGDSLGTREEAFALLFNKYFGHDMYSVVFQEMRECRALGYAAYATVGQDYLRRIPSRFVGFVGTQCDKTNEAVDVMVQLLAKMPRRPDKFQAARKALMASRDADYIDFRQLPSAVQRWSEQGYDRDPREEVSATIRKATFYNMMDFYEQHILGRPLVISLAGNAKQIDMKALSKHGAVRKVKKRDIVRF